MAKAKKKTIREQWACDYEECGHVANQWLPHCPVCSHAMYPYVSDKKVIDLHRNPNEPYPDEGK